MPETVIRQATPADVAGIVALINLGRNAGRTWAQQRWMLAEPAAPGHLHALVGVSGTAVVGHIGCFRAVYQTPAGRRRGLFCSDWFVAPEAHGLLGLKLHLAALRESDFALVLGGTAAAHRVYPALGYRRLNDAPRFVRMTTPLAPLRLAMRLWPHTAPAAGLLYRCLRQHPRQRRPRLAVGTRGVRLTVELQRAAWNPEDTPATVTATGNRPSLARLRWLAGSPSLTPLVRWVWHGERLLGPLVLLVNPHPSCPTGRIAYLPDLGDEPGLWAEVLLLAERLLRQQGCVSFDLLATHPALRGAVTQLGFVETRGTPLFVRDPSGELLTAPWHLTYLEGDVAYRGV